MEAPEISFTSDAVRQMIEQAQKQGKLCDVIELFGHGRWEGLTEEEAAQEAMEALDLAS